MARQKHLDLIERCRIETMLTDRHSFKSIARALNRDPTTIAKEVKAHMFTRKTGSLGKTFNNCANRNTCDYYNICSKTECRNKRCRACKKCYKYCDDYVKESCPLLNKAPYVCNGCKARCRCSLEKQIYSAVRAQNEYKVVLSEARSGICISEKELLALDNIISPLVKQGQSIHHICANNRDLVMYSEKTIYNYFDKGMFTAINLDLPRKVRFRPRRSRHSDFKVDRTCRVGRTYSDFKQFIESNPDIPIVQMDSVIGNIGGKVLLTIHFIKTEFMIAFLRDRNTAASVEKIFNDLYTNLGADSFKKLFKIILTDNGSEFSNPLAIEKDKDGNDRTRIFYCNPSSPYQKGAIEVNHEFIRRVIPKGKSFNDYTQEDINKLMNHINSYKRASLGDKSPYEVFKLFYGEGILKALESEFVPPNDITLTPRLFK